MRKLLPAILICGPLSLHAQQIELLTSGMNTSIRGLSVVDQKTIWASGSNGMVGRSLDGGLHWQWMPVKGHDKSDFRDIEAFDANTAVILKVGEPAYILRTTDGGKNWKTVYKDSSKGVFLDAMAFEGNAGWAVGDPLQNESFTYCIRTDDRGKRWSRIMPENDSATRLENGEAFFASSGTNLVLFRQENSTKKERPMYFVTGGKASHLIRTGGRPRIRLPLIQGKESTGANSIAALDTAHFVVCGGDFLADHDTTANCFLTTDGGKTWIRPNHPPQGYRSCVIYIENDLLLSCGTSGVDISSDGGRNWTLLSREGFHVCQRSKQGNAVFLAGSKGRIARLEGLTYKGSTSPRRRVREN